MSKCKNINKSKSPNILGLQFIIILLFFAFNATKVCGDAIELTNKEVKLKNDSALISFNFKHIAGMNIENVDIMAHYPDDSFSISRYLPKALRKKLLKDKSGKVSFSVPLKYFPRSRKCEFLLKTESSSDDTNRVFSIKDSRCGARIKGLEVSDVELKFRFRYISGMGGPLVKSGLVNKNLKRLMVCLRTKTDITSGMSYWFRWDFCILTFDTENKVSLQRLYNRKWQTLATKKFNYVDGKWHTVTFQIKGKEYSADIDGKLKLSAVEDENFSKKGAIAFTVFDAGFWIDDLKVTDLATGKLLFRDDFERDELGNGVKWGLNTTGGPPFANVDDPDALMHVQRETITDETLIGSITVPKMDRNIPSLPTVEVKKYGAGVRMTINGKPILPLIYSFSSTSYQPLLDDGYKVVGDMYDNGMRLFAPYFSSQMIWNSDRTINFELFDKTMRRLATACPEGYILPRLMIYPPRDFADEDRIKTGRRVNDPLQNFERKTYRFTASLASKEFREAYISAIRQTIEHIRKQPYRDRFIGALILGGGFEGSWANVGGGGNNIIYIDISPALIKAFSEYSLKKYGSVEKIKKAWNMPGLDIKNIPLPGLEERTSSDVAGFRDPSKPQSRWVTDFLDFYGQINDRSQLIPIFASINDIYPGGFFGTFRSASHYARFGAQNMKYGTKLLDVPSFKFTQGCLNYRDRKNGGVSFYTNPFAESMRIRGKLNLGEADIRTHRATCRRHKVHREKSAYDTIQSMWREFGRMILAEGRGYWYFGSSRTAGWWDDKELLDAIKHQEKIGNAAINTDLKDENISKILLVMDNYSWRYFGATPEALTNITDKTRVGFEFIKPVDDLSLFNHLAMLRMGAPINFIMVEDFRKMDLDQYKFFVFPSSFYCDKKMRERIKKLVENGAAVLFFFGDGIVNGENSSLENMRELVNMKIRTAPVGTLQAKTVKTDNILCKDIKPGTLIGNPMAKWHRFYVDDPTATVLARYRNGKPALTVKKVGKGNIIYSALTILPTAFYRNAAKLAGVHVYSDANEALYASKRFLVVNTAAGSSGKRHFSLPEKAPAVYEVISGRLLGKNVDAFSDKLTEKQTAIYYLGNNPEFIKAIKKSAIK